MADNGTGWTKNTRYCGQVSTGAANPGGKASGSAERYRHRSANGLCTDVARLYLSRDMLAQLLNSSSPSVGVGQRKKSEQLLRDLTASGISVPDASLQSVYAPTGLQIGAETAEEIALSIIAEIKAVLSGRRGRRDSRHSIHEHFTPPPAIPVSG